MRRAKPGVRQQPYEIHEPVAQEPEVRIIDHDGCERPSRPPPVLSQGVTRECEHRQEAHEPRRLKLALEQAGVRRQGNEGEVDPARRRLPANEDWPGICRNERFDVRATLGNRSDGSMLALFECHAGEGPKCRISFEPETPLWLRCGDDDLRTSECPYGPTHELGLSRVLEEEEERCLIRSSGQRRELLLPHLGDLPYRGEHRAFPGARVQLPTEKPKRMIEELRRLHRRVMRDETEPLVANVSACGQRPASALLGPGRACPRSARPRAPLGTARRSRSAGSTRSTPCAGSRSRRRRAASRTHRAWAAFRSQMR